MGSSISFRRGDLVQLNSGDQRMLVEEIEDEAGSVVLCKWYEGRERHEKRFYVDALHHVHVSAAGV